MVMISLWTTLALGAAPLEERARIHQAIVEAFEASQEITIDGASQDWSELYHSQGSGAVRRLAIAPTASALKLHIDLSEPLADGALWINIQATGDPSYDLALQLSGTPSAKFFDSQHTATRVGLSGVQVAHQGTSWEAEIPWRSLVKAAPTGVDAPIRQGKLNPWTRVRATVRRHSKRVDGGLAVASYNLTPRPGALDPAPRRGAPSPTPVRLPVEGQWYINHGEFTLPTHKNTWAWDLVRTDSAQRSRPVGAKRVERCLAFGQPLYAPGPGVIERAIDGFPDRHFDDPGLGKEANRVRLDLDDGPDLTLLHLQRGTVAVTQGQHVVAGELLGRVGTSGKTTGPHLHLSWGETGRRPVPVVLTEVWVSLNTGSEGPWRRSLDAWRPAEGFYVTQQQAHAPALAVPAILPP